MTYHLKGKLWLCLFASACFPTIALSDERQIFFRSDALPGNISLNEKEGWNEATLVRATFDQSIASHYQEIEIHKPINLASPQLALMVSSPEPLPELEMVVFDPQNPLAPFFHIELNGVLVHHKTLTSSEATGYEESVTFRFQKATWHYTDFLMWGDEEGLEYIASWNYRTQEGTLAYPEEGFIPDGAFKAFREGLQIEKAESSEESLQLSWPAQEDAIYDIYASPDLKDDFETHVKAVQAIEDGLMNAIVEMSEEHDRMFYIVRLRLED